MKINHPIVIFTSAEFTEECKKLRDHDLDVITLPFNELYYYKYQNRLSQIMTENFNNVQADSRTCPEFTQWKYCVLIFSKIWLLEQVAELNNWNSSFFQWIDFGLHPHVFPDFLLNYKFTNLFKSGKIRLTGFTHSVPPFKPTIDYYNSHCNLPVAAGLFGGDKASIVKFNALFNDSVIEMLKLGVCNSEQQIYYNLLCNHQYLFDYKRCPSTLWDDIGTMYTLDNQLYYGVGDSKMLITRKALTKIPVKGELLIIPATNSAKNLLFGDPKSWSSKSLFLNETEYPDNLDFILNVKTMTQHQPQIIDAFLFYNELEMLEFRLIEHWDIVDKFVIIESTRTFTGREKPLYFSENRERYEKYASKIVHVVFNDELEARDAWTHEQAQRNYIRDTVDKLNLQESDIVFISDVDEIIDTKKLNCMTLSGVNKTYRISQELYYYNLYCKSTTDWHHMVIMNYSSFKGDTPENHRQKMLPIWNGGRAGWHLSYFGGIDNVVNKIETFSHQEFNTAEIKNREKLAERIKNCQDLFNRSSDKAHDFIRVALSENLYLPKNWELLLKFQTV